ncbi:DUF7322 domain-containing protein [Haloplanus aerogenes]|uniref:DUF7322 domain-containing protein n=1 Tax=Haloplanus aerogenes TaxID=660522 RepID=A0A3M0CZG2_9EURY|nr:hypothetical protein [Haloplanus aerogenes]AZH24861.1 hypothetical protein DU502_05520 [Haloplanus aerogenes]RMB13935.1 hypothetical protein ATH50_2378 [Haloplanus aerogenes]
MFDPWPDEPEEPNPESRWDDPERDLPRDLTPDIDEEDVDPEILETFWRSVVLANIALFGLSLGPMLVYFRGQWLWGGAAIALGAVAGLRVYHHYRAFQDRHVDGEDDDATDTAERNA